jgi:phage major head subunit gpT-like protein
MSLPITLAGSLSAAEIAFDARFMKAYQGVTPLHPRVASVITSTNRVQNYPMQAKIAKLRKWEGERQVRNAKAYSYSITNEKYELTLGIPVEDFEDDQLGVYNATIDDMGEQAKLWPDDLVWAALIAGTTETAYDGVAFFADSHALGGNTIDNNFTATALTHPNYAAVREAMQGYAGEDGESLRVVPDLLVVPPALEMQAREILMAEQIDNAAGTASKSNVYKGTADLIVVPQLAASAGGSDTTWYMMATKRAVKPLIFQQRMAPSFVQKNRPDDDGVFYEDQIVYGVRARGAAGYGPFWLAARAIA